MEQQHNEAQEVLNNNSNIVHNFKKKIDKDGVHAEDQERQQMLLVFANVHPPVTECQKKQGPPAGSHYKRAGGNFFDDWGNTSPVKTKT